MPNVEKPSSGKWARWLGSAPEFARIFIPAVLAGLTSLAIAILTLRGDNSRLSKQLEENRAAAGREKAASVYVAYISAAEAYFNASMSLSLCALDAAKPNKRSRTCTAEEAAITHARPAYVTSRSDLYIYGNDVAWSLQDKLTVLLPRRDGNMATGDFKRWYEHEQDTPRQFFELRDDLLRLACEEVSPTPGKRCKEELVDN